MPLPIQALAKGLVGLLELNTDGRGPTSLADQIAAVLDVQPLYLLGKRERFVTGAVAAGAAVGDFSFAGVGLSVPNNEAWWCIHYHISATIPVALTAQMTPTYQISGAVNVVGPTIFNQTNALASVLRVTNDRDFIVPPGGALAGLTNSLSAAVAFNGFGTLEFVRFRL